MIYDPICRKTLYNARPLPNFTARADNKFAIARSLGTVLTYKVLCIVNNYNVQLYCSYR
jgi:hypothetical protein